MYLHWGLSSIDGLIIDGEPATAVGLLEKGPEELTREVVSAIKEQCGLSEPERKTNRRIPFSTWKQGRMELRRVSKKRSREKAEVRLAGA